MQNARLDEAQAGLKIAGRNINNLRYADDTTLMAGSKEPLGESERHPDAGKDWRWEEKGTTEDKTIGWHHQLDGHEFEQAPVVGDGQGSLVCCSPWGHKELDTTERLNWTEWMGVKF